MIPLNKPIINLAGNFESGEPVFEYNNFCTDNFQGYNNAIQYSSRVGLQLVYRYLYEKRGALKVAVSPLTCFDALYPIISNNHKIVFVDIDPNTFNLNEKLLNSLDNIDVIQPIHLGGNPQRMDIIYNWSKEQNVIIIEDCAQALGTYYKNQHVGSFADFAVFSLVKNIHSTLGAILFYKENIIIEPHKQLPFSLQIYKHLKRYLESKCSYSKLNIFNLLLKLILELKKEVSSIKAFDSFDIPLNIRKSIAENFQSFNELFIRRLSNTNRIINALDTEKYAIQKPPTNGLSNRNRLLLFSKDKYAKDLIITLRKKGIAANNLTQNYLASFQEPVWENSTFGKFYNDSKLTNYENLHPYLFSVPNSPALSNKETEYIIYSLNNI